MCSDLFDPQTFRCLVVGLKEDRSLDTREESLAAILDAAARRKTRRNQLGRTARDFRTRIAKWIVVEVGIFENVLWKVKFVISMSQIFHLLCSF